jgi:hypothetical protein
VLRSALSSPARASRRLGAYRTAPLAVGPGRRSVSK